MGVNGPDPGPAEGVGDRRGRSQGRIDVAEGECMNRSPGGNGGERADSERPAPRGSEADRFVTLGERSVRRPLFMGSMLSLTAVAIGTGLSMSGRLNIPGLERLSRGRLAVAAAVKPPELLKPQTDAGSSATPGERAPGAPAEVPPPDPRVVRALDTRVQ